MPEAAAVRPLPPIKPEEKLPEVFHVAIVKAPEKGSQMFAIVVSKTQGDRVLARKVQEPFVQGIDEGLAEMNRVATRIWYFDEGEEHLAP